MRFDDMIATVLAQPAGLPDRQGARWRQLVDLLAQRRERDPDERARAFDFLREHRGFVEADFRRETARTLAGLPVEPDLLAFFAEDAPSVAAPLIAGARLDADRWLAVLPRLGPAARSLLRHRRDLPGEVRAALGAFGSSDFVLESGPAAEGAAESAAAAPAPEPDESQIQELVERIEAYRRRQEEDREAAR